MSHRLAAWAFLIALSPFGGLSADEAKLRSGLYLINFRLELPHLENYADDQTTVICVGQDVLPVPLLSQRDLFVGCRVENVQQHSERLKYNIVCDGRGAARATASYVLAPGEFGGRITIIQGAKNMTMTEVQKGRRIGSC